MRKLIVCDPACVQVFGHNLTTLIYCRDAFSSIYDKVILVGCKALDAEVARAESVLPFYNFYYWKYFPDVTIQERRAVASDPRSLLFADATECSATHDACELLERLEVTADDGIVFPHLDFYGVVGMLNALARLPSERRPSLYLRFIGVMENATSVYRQPLEELISRLDAAFETGLKIRLAAETPRYADHLALKLRKAVTVTSYPNTSEQMAFDESGPFVCYCPGSARHDKGFGELEPIFRAVRCRDRHLNIRFITQILPDSQMKTRGHLATRLYAIPGVELQPAAISAELMLSTYRRAHAVLLPYSPEIYHWRGSAVLMEAAALGRPAISYKGPAYADLIESYNLGVVVDDRDAMIEAIVSMASVPRRTLHLKAMQARHRFGADSAAAFRTWMQY